MKRHPIRQLSIRSPLTGHHLRASTLALLFLLLATCQATSFAQNAPSLQSDFHSALQALPQGAELEKLPPDSRDQVVATRKLYQDGVRFEQMSTGEMLQFSLALKANTARAQQLIGLISHGDCLQQCLQVRSTCKDDCPATKGLVCQCCIRCNLLLDICATNCLMSGQASQRPEPPRSAKDQRNRR